MLEITGLTLKSYVGPPGFGLQILDGGRFKHLDAGQTLDADGRVGERQKTIACILIRQVWDQPDSRLRIPSRPNSRLSLLQRKPPARARHTDAKSVAVIFQTVQPVSPPLTRRDNYGFQGPAVLGGQTGCRQFGSAWLAAELGLSNALLARRYPSNCRRPAKQRTWPVGAR